MKCDPLTLVSPIDPKYGVAVRNGYVEIVKNGTGESIPEDEPLILFRARDRFALVALRAYEAACAADGCTDFHMDGIDNRIAAFAEFKRQHPERMKQPGVTRGK